jgi:hypothetical protein
MTGGLSRQQVTRLVRQYRKDGRLSKHPQRVAPKNGFTCHYTVVDVALLAEMDVLHNTLTGPATKKLMERAFQVFGDVRFERLADISVSHLYNLRGNKPYQNKRRHWTKTNPTGIPIGKRRAPQPNGLRLHPYRQRASRQLGWVNGVYHINAVETVPSALYKPLRLPIRRACCAFVSLYASVDGIPTSRAARSILHNMPSLLPRESMHATSVIPTHFQQPAALPMRNLRSSIT